MAKRKAFMYLEMTIKDVVCYRSKTSYDAEVMISYFDEEKLGEVKTQRLIQANLPTYEEAEKVAVEYVRNLTHGLNCNLALQIQSLKRAQE